MHNSIINSHVLIPTLQPLTDLSPYLDMAESNYTLYRQMAEHAYLLPHVRPYRHFEQMIILLL
jgi:hypothetical protein